MVSRTNNGASRNIHPAPILKSTPERKPKRKTVHSTTEVIDLTTPSPNPKKRKTQDNQAAPKTEKRLRRYRPGPPHSFRQVYSRALTQRMTILDRSRCHNAQGLLEETVKIAGTTGNVYTVKIALVPSCDCPHALQGNQCKHVVYVLSRALKAKSHLQYQLAFLSHELQEMFDAAPLPQQDRDRKADKENDGRRKPIERGDDCPICCVEFEASVRDEIVYCKAACGNNVHRSCFDTWAAQKKRTDDVVTCPLCRTPWQEDGEDISTLVGAIKGGRNTIGEDGYINVARELGLSGHRDCSTYHRPWVLKSRRYY